MILYEILRGFTEMIVNPYVRYIVYIGLLIIVAVIVAVVAYFGLEISPYTPPP